MKELLVLGAEGSGKSLLIRRIKEVAECKFNQDTANEYTIPTTGVEIVNVESSSELSFNVREIGSAISSRWENYLADCCGLVFTIDVSDWGSLSSAMVLVHHEILNNKVVMSKRPIVLAFTKTDCAPDDAVVVAENFLRIVDLQRQWPNVKTVSGSCIDKSLASKIMAWIDSEKVVAGSS